MKTQFITTRIRPIKKMFIIEPDDFIAFERVFNAIQGEVDSIQNLLFVNGDLLWTPTTREFVKRSDPDMIFNLSRLSDEKLSRHFDVMSIVPQADNDIPRFGTHLTSFTRKPAYFSMNGIELGKFHVLSGTELKDSPLSLLAAVNYGVTPNDEQLPLEMSIFRGMTSKKLRSLKDTLGSIFVQNGKFNYLTNYMGSFGSYGYGTSIFYKDYNHEGLFKSHHDYILISRADDFASISYFWNSRSYYTRTNLAWVPIDYLRDIASIVKIATVFVCLEQQTADLVAKAYPMNQLIQPSALHFEGKLERWTYLKHDQSITIIDQQSIVHHPAEKSYSEGSATAAYVLEIIGLEELSYPRHRSQGRLYSRPNEFRDQFHAEFQRLSENGLATYTFQFNPTSAEDIAQEIILPGFEKIANHLFSDIGYTVSKTQKSLILEQLVKLLGGAKEAGFITEEKVFNLLVALTPKERTEKVVKQLLAGQPEGIDSDHLMEVIGEIRATSAINFPSVTLTMEAILAKITGVGAKEKPKYHALLQKLYDRKLLLRGKFFDCPHCASHLWIQIDEIKRSNYCIECSNEISLPVFSEQKQASDHFRLNQLMVRAVDQGQLTTLLAIKFFDNQNYRSFMYLSNLDLLANGSRVTDIDLLVKTGKRIGIVECKSNHAFVRKQVEELIVVAGLLKCDFIAFSSLCDHESEIIKNLVQWIGEQTLSIPAFILTKRALFSSGGTRLEKYFELGLSRDFVTGPIII